MLKKPALRSCSADINKKADNSGDTDKPNPENFPAGRIIKGPAPAPAEHILTANMTGQVLLTGGEFDLQFNRGSLKRISRNDTILFDRLNSRTRFKTSRGSIEYRNESAFSFEGDSEYGLRTLQVPKKRKRYNCRVITDYAFSREHGECFITATVDYPEFGKNIIVNEASVFEFRIENTEPEGIRISSNSSTEKIITTDNSSEISIEGNIFKITKGDRTMILSLKPPSGSSHKSLSVKPAKIKGRYFIYINPGGSYTPRPAEYYNGIHDQIHLQLGID